MSEMHDMLPVKIDAATTAGMTYIKYVQLGSSTNDNEANCSILRINESVADITEIGWANGDKLFNNAWADRATITYLPLIR